MRSTFAAFTTAQLGLRASQQGLNVTGQNISNINTTGYTRQALDQISLNFTGGGRYSTNNNIGFGTLVKNITQIRDPFLDIRFRSEISNVGEADVRLTSLKELETIFDEVAQNGLQTQISDLSSMLQKLADNAGSQTSSDMVKSSAEALTKLFNQYAKQIQSVRENQEYELREVDVPGLNSILKNISELNVSIKNGQINGSNTLELLDQRNMLIDELATYVKIDVKYVPVEVSKSLTVDELKIDFIGDKHNINLINGVDYAAFQMPAGTTKLNIVDQSGNPIKDALGNVIGEDLFSELTTGSLKSALEMLNCSGDFDGSSSSPRGIGYYEKMLDLMASKFASVFNGLNNANLPSGTPAEDLHNLFSSSDGGAVTAKTISIAEGWSTDKYGITASVENPDNNAANDNILKMISALTSDQTFVHPGKNPADPSDDQTMFTGSFHSFFSKLNTTLGIDIKSTSSTLDNYISVANEISNSRESISGVNLDEEGMNMLKYQKAYNAAARLMTVLDEALDTLINRMGVVGN